MPLNGTTRRAYLSGLATAGTVAVAGCGGTEETGEGTTTETGTSDEGDEGTASESVTTFRYDTANSGAAPELTGPSGTVQQQWAYDAGGLPSRGFAVTNGSLYFGSRDEYAGALDVSDGTEQWRSGTWDEVWGGPVVADGAVYVGNEGEIDAFDTETGDKQWNYWSKGTNGSLALADSTVYAGTNNGLRGIDTSSGNDTLFVRNGLIDAKPAVVSGTAYVAKSYGPITAIDTDSENELWTFGPDGSVGVRSAPAVVDETLYVGGGDNDFWAIDTASGAEQWSLDTDASVAASPAVADGTVYFGNADGGLNAVTAADGASEWSTAVDGAVYYPPALVDGTLYVGTQAGTLYALAPSTGSERWSFDLGAPMRTEPVVANGTIYVGAGTTIYALAA